MLRAAIENSGRALFAARAAIRENSAGWSERLAGKNDNSFDAIRLFLAILVVFEHSWFLTQNSYDAEPLYVLTAGQTNSGALAVYMFFAISGFLVTRSWLLTGDVRRYLMKRIGRIVPGFLAATFIACILLAPLTARDATAFFAGQKWTPLVAQALALRQINVSGILDGNPVQLIHGTLWTIKIEFDCYLLTAVVGSLGLLTPRRAWIVFLALLAIFTIARAGAFQLPTIDHGIASLLISSPDQWPSLFPFFIAGSAFYIYRDSIPKQPVLFWASLLVVATSALTGGMYWALLLAGTYAVIWLALSCSAGVSVFGRRADLSYGVYLYGWPVAQLLVYFSHQTLQPLPLFALTMAITFIFAYASWRIVEAPSLAIVSSGRAAAVAA